MSPSYVRRFLIVGSCSWRTEGAEGLVAGKTEFFCGTACGIGGALLIGFGMGGGVAFAIGDVGSGGIVGRVVSRGDDEDVKSGALDSAAALLAMVWGEAKGHSFTALVVAPGRSSGATSVSLFMGGGGVGRGCGAGFGA